MLFRSNDTATTEIYTTANTLSLHDALPISGRDHLAGGLDPGHQRQLDRVGPALAMLEVNVVHADPAVADEELVGARNRLGALDRPQRSRPAVPSDLDRQHRRRGYTAR